MCLVVLHLELSIQAKGVLLARENGLDIAPSEDLKAKLEELEYLEKSIGRAGRMAMAPIFNLSSRDIWEVYFLKAR